MHALRYRKTIPSIVSFGQCIIRAFEMLIRLNYINEISNRFFLHLTKEIGKFHKFQRDNNQIKHASRHIFVSV